MRYIAILLLASTLQLPAQHSPALRTDKRVVITIDDLPCVRCAGEIGEQVTDDLLRTLTTHSVPAIGFVNESKIEIDGLLDSARYQLLARWLEAGMELGNHTYAHAGATHTTAVRFEEDVAMGERHLRPLMQQYRQQLRYFRHPFLQTGATPERRDSLNAMLAGRGYTVAPVTFDNDEYMYAHCFDQAAQDGEDSVVRVLAEGYLRYMAEVTRFHEAQARSFFGREIPHILLIHANALNAACLDALLTWFEGEGYAFIPLETALQDDCYRLPEATTRYGFSWIRRWQLAAGQEPPWPPEIEPEVQQRYDAIQHR